MCKVTRKVVKQVKFYSVDLFLTNVQTREQVWQGNKKD